MTGTRPNLFWMVCWKYITPAALTVILVASFYNIVKENPSYKLYVGCLQQEVRLYLYYFFVKTTSQHLILNDISLKGYHINSESKFQ